MELLKFTELSLTPKMMSAIEEMGFETSTEIQTKAIPLIREGVDVIGKSQTGTGKTMAFSIPAVEIIDTKETKPTVQVLVLCPTRELAQQACEEIKKLTKFIPGINAAEVYGGASMERQIMKLKRANIVVGTPGRIMDHLERRTLKLGNLKMVVLDEADEMLNMGFKEDVESILKNTPEAKQTVLFSATMPPAIMALTKQFQRQPHLVEVSKKQVTLDNITQKYVDVAMGRKMDALHLMMRYYAPALTMVFCNTKAMVDDIAQFLKDNGFAAEGLHGDMKQAVRTKVLDDFKKGRTSILIATDVAARGIDVNNIEYVINYDVPQNNEYYVHRIGRTGRAGKTGTAITICSGKRQVFVLRNIAKMLKSNIDSMTLPKAEQILEKIALNQVESVENILTEELNPVYGDMLNTLLSKGHSLHTVAQAVLQLHFGKSMPTLEDVATYTAKSDRGESRDRGDRGDRRSSGGMVTSSPAESGYTKILLTVGRSGRVAPNHIVGAITERTNLRGNQIGKIEIYDDNSLVSLPSDMVNDLLDQLQGLKICGKPTQATMATEGMSFSSGTVRRNDRGGKKSYNDDRGRKSGYKDDRKSRFFGGKGKSGGGRSSRKDSF